MKYSHIKQPGLFAVMLLAGVVSYINHSPPTSPHSVSVGYAKHGLRAYVDPDTGQFGRPPEHLADKIGADMTGPSFSAQAISKQAVTVTLTEQATSKPGGGYIIDLRERFRPSRKGS